MPRQELPGHAHITLHAARGQAPLNHQIPAILPEQHLHRRRDRILRSRHDTLTAQEAQQRRHRPDRQPLAMPAGTPRRQELLDPRRRQLTHRHALKLQPATQMGHQM
jgi:hypothetical protein